MRVVDSSFFRGFAVMMFLRWRVYDVSKSDTQKRTEEKDNTVNRTADFTVSRPEQREDVRT